MNDYAGESGGGSSTPQPTVEYEAVKMDTASVKSFGDALVKDAENMDTVSQDVRGQLVNPADPRDKLGQHTTFPVGADPRQETLHSIVVEHSQRMHETHILLNLAAINLHNTGRICQIIAAAFGDVDALNATSVDQVRGLINDVTSTPEKPEVA